MVAPPYLGLPFTIGNDICHILRIARLLKGKNGVRFVRRVLRDDEISHLTTPYALQHVAQLIAQNAPPGLEGADPTTTCKIPGITNRVLEFMAGRFAAKEAVIKAHPFRRLAFHDISIVPAVAGASGASRTQADVGAESSASQSGPLVALIKAKGAHPDTYAPISISHDTHYATAVCVGINPNSQLWQSLKNTSL
ncbi:hypothetical protein NUW58_g7888 [Xylaria curta]|uniref:Uncharacterized protein n=1 Tax=Xylaria curta TaxID=42375 RepID=A0ACC1NCY7_9PEZI|nr:hypothetical protein NUW58_g7888 [Xylaria curta]